MQWQTNLKANTSAKVETAKKNIRVYKESKEEEIKQLIVEVLLQESIIEQSNEILTYNGLDEIPAVISG